MRTRTLQVTAADGSSQPVLVTWPAGVGHADAPAERWPLVVALHGRGEAVRGVAVGHRAFHDDYALPAAFAALARGRLARADLRGHVRRAHLDAINAALRAAPFRGVAVVTPYTPDLLRGPREDELERYCAWLARPLLEQVRAALPFIARGREGTGVDGISLGGMVALEAGSRHPEAFGAVGGIQPAINGRVRALAERLSAAARPTHLRLLSSDDDPFLPVVRELSEALSSRRVEHRLVVVPGPHDYSFNRGPGVVELLRFHGEVLERERR